MTAEPFVEAPSPNRVEPTAPEPEERRICQRAYLIWEEEGKPDGRALDHWLRAKWELKALDSKEELERLERELAPSGIQE